MKAVPPWVTFTVLRLLLFIVPLAIMLVFAVAWPIAVIAAALIGFALSYLLLRRPRNAVALELHEVRSRGKRAPAFDDDIEDSQVDEAEAALNRSKGVRGPDADAQR